MKPADQNFHCFIHPPDESTCILTLCIETSKNSEDPGEMQHNAVWETLLMPLLHLLYDEYTMPVGCPNHHFRAASAGRPFDHRTDLRASWPLRFCLTPHNDKFEKIVSPYPADTSQ